MHLAHLTPLALILAVLGEKAAEEVATAASHVHQRPFLPQAQTGGHHQHQGDGLDQQGPLPQVAPDDEAAQNGLYLQEDGERERVSRLDAAARKGTDSPALDLLDRTEKKLL